MVRCKIEKMGEGGGGVREGFRFLGEEVDRDVS